MLKELSAETRRHEYIKHALKVSDALACNNYHMLFGRLYHDAPNMGAYLMDIFIGQYRVKALKIMMKAYFPTIPVEFLKTELGFEDEEEFMEFLDANKIVLDKNNIHNIDCKQTAAKLT
eukprot:GEZU01024870.1.p3 GENE.GEZU01024870.1~~GEZU01024870.1.p3  ORF type:complete len:119 (-),score=38.79 GEZU01024870.1:523-879(-)